MSNFDLESAVRKLPIKHFRGVFSKDQLPSQPNINESGIINLDDHVGPGTHWVCYVISPPSIIYFDSYGLPPPVEFINYVNKLRNGKSERFSSKNLPIWYSTLPTQTLTDPPICGREVLNALMAASTSSLPVHKAINEYTIENHK